jgi:hypothetical protein
MRHSKAASQNAKRQILAMSELGGEYVTVARGKVITSAKLGFAGYMRSDRQEVRDQSLL